VEGTEQRLQREAREAAAWILQTIRRETPTESEVAALATPMADTARRLGCSMAEVRRAVHQVIRAA
jgi:hypothetical protein